MATHDYVIANGTGSAVRSDLNNALAAIVSNNSSSTEPATKYAYQWWADTNTNILKIRNSANSAWINVRGLDGTALIGDGSPAEPGLAFSTDQNTGIFTSAADTIGFTTGGVERLEIGSSEIVFNDGSNDVDFRVESNGQTHMLFVDGGNDRVGIGKASPDQTFHVKTTSDDVAKLESTSGGNGPNLTFAHTGSSPADDDVIGKLTFTATNDASQQTTFGDIRAVSSDVSDGSEDGALTFNTRADGSFAERLRISSDGNLNFSQATASNFPEQKLKWSNDSGTTNGFYISQDSDRNAKIFHEQGLDIVFGTNNNERMRLSSSGKLLVGTTSEIESSTHAKIQIVSTGGGHLSLGRNDSSVSNGNDLGLIRFYSNDGGSYQEAARIECEADGDHANNDKPSRLVFSTTADGASSPTERMRIGTNGLIATHMSSTSGLVLGTAGNATNYTIIKGKSSSTGINTGNDVFYVYGNGNVQNSNNSYGQISDQKLKENIVDANSQWDNIKDVKVRNFNFIEGQTHTQIGVVAQELEAVSPGLVDEAPDRDEDGNDLGTVTKSVKYSVLYMKAVKALQEAMARIETLETKVAALEAG